MTEKRLCDYSPSPFVVPLRLRIVPNVAPVMEDTIERANRLEIHNLIRRLMKFGTGIIAFCCYS